MIISPPYFPTSTASIEELGEWQLVQNIRKDLIKSYSLFCCSLSSVFKVLLGDALTQIVTSSSYSVDLCSNLGFPDGSTGKESPCNAGDLGLIPGLGRTSGEGNANPLQYSCLENSIDRGAWLATVHGVAKSRTQLSDFHLLHYILQKVELTGDTSKIHCMPS